MSRQRFNDGKVALVTGGSRGIGKGIVQGLLNEGATVYALAKSEDGLAKLKAQLPSVNVVQVDLADWDATKRAVEQVGIVDLLVNNAGIAFPLKNVVDNLELRENLEQAIDINLKSAINIAQIIARGLISTGRSGSIVNISSVATKVGFPGALPYCVAKCGLEMATKCMALELGPYKIRVNSVNPTFVRTDMTEHLYNDQAFMENFIKKHPLRKFAEIKDVVEATLFLLSDEASMITGTILPIDGGWMVN